jgi:peptide-methionine (S)-S-oxide reductase
MTMKSSLFPLTLFFVLMMTSTACESQKTTQTASQATAKSEPVAGITIDELDESYVGFEKAYLAGGCFWCTEASLDRIKGVADVFSGYAGGEELNPTYKQMGQVGHAEAIVVYFDAKTITYEEILDVFFVAHDPTQLNRQGPDRGKQYRSSIFPLNDEQDKIARAKIAALDASGTFSSKIVTTIEDYYEFYLAEAYHQDYFEDPSNPNQGYVQNVSRPKVEKVMKVFKDRVKGKFLK